MATLNDFLSLTENVSPHTNDGWYLISCIHPNHWDEAPSLGVKSIVNAEGKEDVLVYCHAGCDKTELFQIANGKAVLNPSIPKKVLEKISKGEEYKSVSNNQRELVCAYDYVDENGVLLFQKLRYKNPKSFAFRSPKTKKEKLLFGGDTKWTFSLDGNEHQLYKLDILSKLVGKNTSIIVDESEKNVDYLINCGSIATCSSSSSVWKDEWNQYFEGKDIIIFPHNDDKGKDVALRIFSKYKNTCNSLKIIHLPVNSAGDDVLDWMEKYGGSIDLLWELVDSSEDVKQQSEDEVKYYLYNRGHGVDEPGVNNNNEDVLLEQLEELPDLTEEEYIATLCQTCFGTNFQSVRKDNELFVISSVLHEEDETPTLIPCFHDMKLSSNLTSLPSDTSRPEIISSSQEYYSEESFDENKLDF